VKPNTDVASLAAVAREVFAPLGTAASKVTNTMRGLALPVPIAVDHVATAVRDVAGADDELTVQTALGSWDDLVHGRTVIESLSAIIDSNLPDLQLAKRVADSKPLGLDDQFVADHAELCDLLAAGELATKLGRIVALANGIEKARTERLRSIRERLQKAVAEERDSLSTRYAQLEPDVIAEALADLDRLVPADGDGTSADVLEARCDAISTTAAKVQRRLDEVIARDRLATVSVTEVVADLITSPDDLDAALERIRARVEGLLADGKQVRLT